MNERIWELAKQAYSDDMPYDSNIPGEFIVRLSELIVKECIGVIEEVGNQHRVGDQVTESDVCGHKIKQHFGVEE